MNRKINVDAKTSQQLDYHVKYFQKVIRRRRASNLIVHLKKEDDMCIDDTKGRLVRLDVTLCRNFMLL